MFPSFGDRMSKPKWSPSLELQRILKNNKSELFEDVELLG